LTFSAIEVARHRLRGPLGGRRMQRSCTAASARRTAVRSRSKASWMRFAEGQRKFWVGEFRPRPAERADTEPGSARSAVANGVAHPLLALDREHQPCGRGLARLDRKERPGPSSPRQALSEQGGGGPGNKCRRQAWPDITGSADPAQAGLRVAAPSASPRSESSERS